MVAGRSATSPPSTPRPWRPMACTWRTP